MVGDFSSVAIRRKIYTEVVSFGYSIQLHFYLAATHVTALAQFRYCSMMVICTYDLVRVPLTPKYGASPLLKPTIQYLTTRVRRKPSIVTRTQLLHQRHGQSLLHDLMTLEKTLLVSASVLTGAQYCQGEARIVLQGNLHLNHRG